MDVLKKNLKNNCVPEEVFTMEAADYRSFLEKRRLLMSKKIKEYYISL